MTKSDREGPEGLFQNDDSLLGEAGKRGDDRYAFGAEI